MWIFVFAFMEPDSPAFTIEVASESACYTLERQFLELHQHDTFHVESCFPAKEIATTLGSYIALTENGLNIVEPALTLSGTSL